MGVGLVEQAAKQHAAREDTAGIIAGTARQRKREREGMWEDRPQLEEKQAEEVNKQLSRHQIAARKLAFAWPCVRVCGSSSGIAIVIVMVI